MGLPAVIPVEPVNSELVLPNSRIAIASQPISVSRQSVRRIPALDGLRGIAILLVLLRHSVAGSEATSRFWSALLAPLRLTWSGVDLFFVLSGFLIGGILLDARNSPRYFRTFYIRRAFRILPVYYIFLALYFARHLPIPMLRSALGNLSPFPIPFLSFVTFTHNFWMVAFGWFGSWGIAPTWSLAIEEQFYLTAPLLIRKMSIRSLYVVLASIIAIAPVLRAILPHLLQHGAFANYVLMPCRADALSMGVMAALLYRNTLFKAWIKRNVWFAHSAVCATFIGILFLTYRAWDQYTAPMATWGLTCLALFYTWILLSVVYGLNSVIERVLRFRPLMQLGTLAYCTYLIHPVMMQAARWLLRIHSSLPAGAVWPMGGILGIGVALIFASMSWKFLESPLLRRAHEYQF